MIAQEAEAQRLRAARRRRRLDNLGRGALLGVLITVLPLIRNTALQEQFNVAKQIFAGWIVCLALAWWGLGMLAGRRFRLNAPLLAWTFLGFWAAHVLGWLVALRGGSSLGLASERLAWATVGLLLFLALQDFARGRRRYLLALGWLQIISASVTALWVLTEDFTRPAGLILRLPDWRGYLSAGLGNSGHIADWIALSFPPALLLLLRVRRAWLASALIAHLGMGAMALIVCWSVHSNAGLIAGLLFLLIYLVRRDRHLLARRGRRLAALLFVWAGAVLFFNTPHPLNPHRPTIFHEAFGSARWKEGGSSRLLIWTGSLSVIRERPILGWGTGNFTYAYPQVPNEFVGEDSPHAAAVGQWTNAAHNVFLQIWADLGLPGLVLFAMLLWAWFGEMRRTLPRSNPVNRDIRLAATAIGLMALVHGMMNFVLQLPSFLLYYAALAALPLCLVDRNRALKEHRMEFEFDFHWVQVILRGEGMLSLRGLALSFDLPRWARIAAGAGLVLLVLLLGWRGYRRFAAYVYYKPGYELVQHRGGTMPELAEFYLTEALDRWPSLVDARADRAKLHYLQGDWNEVVRDATESMRRLQAPKLYLWRGEALLRTGRPDEARDDFFTVLSRLRPWAPAEPEAERLLSIVAATPAGRAFAGH